MNHLASQRGLWLFFWKDLFKWSKSRPDLSNAYLILYAVDVSILKELMAFVTLRTLIDFYFPCFYFHWKYYERTKNIKTEYLICLLFMTQYVSKYSRNNNKIKNQIKCIDSDGEPHWQVAILEISADMFTSFTHACIHAHSSWSITNTHVLPSSGLIYWFSSLQPRNAGL